MLTAQRARRHRMAAMTGAILFAIGFLASAPARGADPPPPQERGPRGPVAVVEATGEGVVTETPDVAVASVGVTTEAPTAGAAMAKNAEVAARVVKALRDRGLTAADAIRTQAIVLGPVHETKPVERPRIVGYRASNQVQIRVTDLTLLGPVLDAALQAGATDIGGPTFVLANPHAAELRAVEAAVKVAREQAEVMARALGQGLGRVLKVQTLDEGGFPRQGTVAFARTAAAPIPVEPGTLSVRARVLIRVELQ